MDESRRLIMMLRTALIGVDERAFNSERSWRKEEVSSRISQEDEARIMEEVKANVGGDGPFVVERIAHGVAQKCIERRAETLSGLRRLSCPIGPVQVLNALFVVLEIDVPAHLKPHQIVDQTVLDSIRLLDPSKPGRTRCFFTCDPLFNV
uniref:Uncharacterized protein n=1 Tax=Spongospora subterranea TaxID=70186 RepID=A0A0H5QGM4_9EUKA